MILKDSSRPRRTRAELELARKEIEDEKGHFESLKSIEAEYVAKRYKLEDGLNAIMENEKMMEIMKEKGIMDNNGILKA